MLALASTSTSPGTRDERAPAGDAARVRDRGERRGRAGAARRAARVVAIARRGADDARARRRAPRERAPGRGAQDVRARDRPPRPRRAGAADRRGAASPASRMRAEWRRRAASSRSLRAIALSTADARPRRPPQRIAAQLARARRALRALQRARTIGASAMPVGFDVARWMRAVRDGARARRSSRRTTRAASSACGCADIARAVRDARARATRACSPRSRGAAPRPSARSRAGVPTSSSRSRRASSRAPIRGAALPGCVYLGASPTGGAGARRGGRARGIERDRCAAATSCDRRATTRSRCAHRAASRRPTCAADDARWKVPPSLAAMLRPLESLHAAARPARPRRQPRSSVAATSVDVGFSIDLTIDPRCRRSRSAPPPATPAARTCAARSGIARRGRRGRRSAHRAARARDGAHGRDRDRSTSRAAASRRSPARCRRARAQEYDGPGRAAKCDARLPYPIRYRPDALLNPAVFHDAMPASTIKPIMAAAFLSDRGRRARAGSPPSARRSHAQAAAPTRRQPARPADALGLRALSRSHVLRATAAFAPCARPWEVQAAARAFGWNAGCTRGERALRQARPAVRRGRRCRATTAARARSRSRSRTDALLVEPVGAASARRSACVRRWRSTPARSAAAPRAPTAGARARTTGRSAAAARSSTSSPKAGGRATRARARSARAGMMARARRGRERPGRRARSRISSTRCAARGVAGESARERAGSRRRRAAELHRARDAAEVILSGLSYSHRAGTVAARVRAGVRRARSARASTGSPARPGRRRFRTTIARSTSCATLCVAGVREEPRASATRCGPLRPYKWYVAAYRTDPANPRWTKAIGVLVERNWLADTRPHPRRRRPRSEPRGRDRDADRRAPRRRARVGARGEARFRARAVRDRGRASAVRWCGRSTVARGVPRRRRGHAAARDRAGRRRRRRSPC